MTEDIELVKNVKWCDRIISYLVTPICKLICKPTSNPTKGKWPTFKKFDHNFYEQRESHSNTNMRIREPLIYSKGKWLTPSSQTKQQYVQFRGINLPAKTPLATEPTIGTEKKAISFIDRPFPILDAPSHFERLSNYGFNIVRLTVTWETVMHAGPGIIDHDYLQYLSDLVDVACAYGIYVLIDPQHINIHKVHAAIQTADSEDLRTIDAQDFIEIEDIVEDTIMKST